MDKKINELKLDETKVVTGGRYETTAMVVTKPAAAIQMPSSNLQLSVAARPLNRPAFSIADLPR